MLPRDCCPREKLEALDYAALPALCAWQGRLAGGKGLGKPPVGFLGVEAPPEIGGADVPPPARPLLQVATAKAGVAARDAYKQEAQALRGQWQQRQGELERELEAARKEQEAADGERGGAASVAVPRVCRLLLPMALPSLVDAPSKRAPMLGMIGGAHACANQQRR